MRAIATPNRVRVIHHAERIYIPINNFLNFRCYDLFLMSFTEMHCLTRSLFKKIHDIKIM